MKKKPQKKRYPKWQDISCVSVVSYELQNTINSCTLVPLGDEGKNVYLHNVRDTQPIVFQSFFFFGGVVLLMRVLV